MKASQTKFIAFLLVTLTGLGAMMQFSVPPVAQAQQPTGSVPTVTGTATGMIVRVNYDIEITEVYSGPSQYLYPSIGVLLKGQNVPALGISEDGDYIQVYYPGVPGSVAWVYGPYVTIIKTGRLPVLPAPPTPTIAATPTIDPTLVSAFIPAVTSTRLPTFTPPPQLVIATFLPEETVTRVPMGLLIFGLGMIGIFGTLISFLRGQ
jgi:hypothetical protein